MKFEYDLNKSEGNRKKHGIDFKEAAKLWRGKTVVLKARDEQEQRSLVIGKIDDCYWSAIITRRGDVTRIISVRRARDEEKSIYDRE